jgi:hypothetical protein
MKFFFGAVMVLAVGAVCGGVQVQAHQPVTAMRENGAALLCGAARSASSSLGGQGTPECSFPARSCSLYARFRVGMVPHEFLAKVEWPRNQPISQVNAATISFGIAGAGCACSRRFAGGKVLRMLSVRNTWTGLNSFEKAAIVLSVIALTLAVWALGSLAMP